MKSTITTKLEQATRPQIFALAIAVLTGIGAAVGNWAADFLAALIPGETLVQLLFMSIGALSCSALYIVIRGKIDSDKSALPPKLAKSDIALFRKLESYFHTDTYTFLREQDMGAHFHESYVTPLFDYRSTWKGPHYKFLDSGLDHLSETLRSNVDALAMDIIQHTSEERGFYSIGMDDAETNPEIFRIRDELCRKAHKAADSLDIFLRAAKARIAESEE